MDLFVYYSHCYFSLFMFQYLLSYHNHFCYFILLNSQFSQLIINNQNNQNLNFSISQLQYAFLSIHHSLIFIFYLYLRVLYFIYYSLFRDLQSHYTIFLFIIHNLYNFQNYLFDQIKFVDFPTEFRF
jgi:hypothetical protein